MSETPERIVLPRRTPQEIAREALTHNGLTSFEQSAVRYMDALRNIASMPEPAVPFALPVSESEAMRVDRVISVWRMDDGSAAIRTCPTNDEASVFARGKYAAAWLSLFGVPEKEAGK